MPARVTDTSLAEHWSSVDVPLIITEADARRILRTAGSESWIRSAAADLATPVHIVQTTPLPLGDREVLTLEVRIGTPPLACTAHLWVDDHREWRCTAFYSRSDISIP